MVQPSEHSSRISKRDVLVFLFKWKGTILGWALFTVAVVGLLAYVIPPAYVATSKVVMKSSKAPELRATYAAGLESVEVMNNEIEIIRSRAVMSAVVDELEPHLLPSRPSRLGMLISRLKDWMTDVGLVSRLEPRQAAIEGLLSAVKAESVVNSNVVEIAYASGDPEWAARVVNAVTDHYLARHMLVYSSQDVTNFYREQMTQAESELERLRDELVAFKQRGAISAVADRRSELVRELSSIRENLAAARDSYQELLTRFERGHVDVQLAARRVAGARARERDIQQQLEALEKQQSDIAALEVRIRSQESTYLDLKRNYEQTRLNAASNSEAINVRLLEHASVPVRPRFSRLTLILLAVPIGLLLSLSVALLREYLDHRVHDPDTAEHALGAPCLGSVALLGLVSRHRLGV